MSKLTQWMLNKYYPIQNDPFHDLVIRSIVGCDRVLDAGCGVGKIFQYSFTNKTKLLVGLDLRLDLAENNQVQCATRASVVQMPFANQSFDLIFSRFLLEHVEQPQTTFNEFARVLKPGGKLIILTPNSFHYFPVAGKLIPNGLHKYFARLVSYRDEDTFMTYYRANSKRKLVDFGKNVSLSLENIIMNEPCPYFLSFSPITLAPAIFYERTINRFRLLSNLRAHIIAVYTKDCKSIYEQA
jgi:SAM-dependent methyltransferase